MDIYELVERYAIDVDATQDAGSRFVRRATKTPFTAKKRAARARGKIAKASRRRNRAARRR